MVASASLPRPAFEPGTVQYLYVSISSNWDDGCIIRVRRASLKPMIWHHAHCVHCIMRMQGEEPRLAMLARVIVFISTSECLRCWLILLDSMNIALYHVMAPINRVCCCATHRALALHQTQYLDVGRAPRHLLPRERCIALHSLPLLGDSSKYLSQYRARLAQVCQRDSPERKPRTAQRDRDREIERERERESTFSVESLVSSKAPRKEKAINTANKGKTRKHEDEGRINSPSNV